jgi:hypothetical protein
MLKPRYRLPVETPTPTLIEMKLPTFSLTAAARRFATWIQPLDQGRRGQVSWSFASLRQFYKDNLQAARSAKTLATISCPENQHAMDLETP